MDEEIIKDGTNTEDSGSAVDFLLGGEETSHSQEEKTELVTNVDTGLTEAEDNGNKDDAPLTNDKEDENVFEDNTFSDSAEDKKAEEAKTEKADAPKADNVGVVPNQAEEAEKLKREIENKEKRLHDTQVAYHKATTENAELRKRIDELEKKQNDPDDWFNDDDEKKVAELKEELKKSDKELSDLKTQNDNAYEDVNASKALAVWDAAVVEVKKNHPDFDKVVYDTLAPKLDAKTGDARVIKLWNMETDKSPANAYKFATELEDRLLMQSDPNAYKEKIRAEIRKELNPEDEAVTGKAGLDLLNSADSPVQTNTTIGETAVDFIFK